MDSTPRDTIAAVATAAGAAAIAVVRISGPDALSIAKTLTGKTLTPRHAEYCSFRNAGGEIIDRGIALSFPAPHSFTGEDVVEFQGHGGPVVVDWLLAEIHRLGARPAEAGEFSLRAFLNDKLDLTQAEAIADLIASSSRAQAKAALGSLEGRFSQRVSTLQAALTELRVLCEAWLDFPEEEIDRAAAAELETRINAIGDQLESLAQKAAEGVVLNDGLNIVIAGPPNAGKSSLLNRLAGLDAAIVTAIPGTTRDTLRQRVLIDGLVVNVVDTAGLRDTEDPVEVEGVRRAEAAIGKANHVLWVADIQAGLESALASASGALGSDSAYTLLLNKVDLTTGVAAVSARDGVSILEISALTGAGMNALAEHLKSVAGFKEPATGSFSARRRHLAALARVRTHVEATRPLLGGALELAAEELRGAQQALSELTGEFSSDDLLGEIFSSFCIGK